ncbi:MAG: PHP-associated domain-containing protein [Lentisphaeria bacterium]|jgi:predicted metal-dependent phosphoesterase TrpH|nr:PHP-associated domain-containing protein [Lentisphaeria bacterium]
MTSTRFDLHLHSALSACAENTMSPRQIVARAVESNLDMIAVTDHNASAHAPLLARLGEACGLVVVPGMEVTSREEVHLLALFADLAGLRAFQETVDGALPEARNDADYFGWQLVYDERDEVVDVDDRLRQIGIGLGLDALVERIHAGGGVAVPAHVFRARNSLTSQLGFVNPGAGYDAVEVSVRSWRQQGLRLGQTIADYPVIVGSDAHFIEDIGRCPAEVPRAVRTVPELLAALRQMEEA